MADDSTDEATRILAFAKGDATKAFALVERQLEILVLRTQAMLSLSGIVITVTGFSGRAIAETNAAARLCITSGIFLVLAAAIVAMAGVMRLTWLTQELGSDPLETIRRGLELRARKGRSLSIALALFCAGFSLYVIAVAQLLWAARPPA